jgi:hypothetical protein
MTPTIIKAASAMASRIVSRSRSSRSEVKVRSLNLPSQFLVPYRILIREPPKAKKRLTARNTWAACLAARSSRRFLCSNENLLRLESSY